LLDKSRYLNAFLLVHSTEKQANDLFLQSLEALKQGDTRKAFILGLKSKQLNYQPRGQLDYILGTIYQELLKSQAVILNQKQ